jgi:hypothetical protein
VCRQKRNHEQIPTNGGQPLETKPSGDESVSFSNESRSGNGGPASAQGTTDKLQGPRPTQNFLSHAALATTYVLKLGGKAYADLSFALPDCFEWGVPTWKPIGKTMRRCTKCN